MNGYIRFSSEFLRDRLMLPKGWTIVSIQFDANAVATISVTGPKLPLGYDAEILGEFTRHEDGIDDADPFFVRWLPAPDPGPSTFLRLKGTESCCWCHKEKQAHRDGKFCDPDPFEADRAARLAKAKQP
jgi:hypothetical protein